MRMVWYLLFLAGGFLEFSLHICNLLYIVAQQTPSSFTEGVKSYYNVATVTDNDFNVTSTVGVNDPHTLYWSKWAQDCEKTTIRSHSFKINSQIIIKSLVLIKYFNMPAQHNSKHVPHYLFNWQLWMQKNLILLTQLSMWNRMWRWSALHL